MRETVRAFLALELPDVVQSGIRAFACDAREGLGGWRWTLSGLHVTVRFLGDVSADFLESATSRWREELARCSAPAFRLSGIGVFPSLRSPRVLWIGVEEEGEGGRLDAIFRTIEAVCVSGGLAPEPRSFRPHLTIARAPRGGMGVPPPAGLGASWGPVRSDAVTLFRSDLRPEGAKHTVLERFPLEPSV